MRSGGTSYSRSSTRICGDWPASYLSRERADHSLSATDLVHEAYGRLADQTRVDWQGRSHFFAISATAMRRILIDHARRHTRTKRGGEWQRVTLDPGAPARDQLEFGMEELIELDRALTALAAIDARQAQVVEMRYFAGMSIPEVADALGISKRSVDRDWIHAKSWLKRELREHPPARDES